MPSFELVHIAATDLRFSDYFYVDLSGGGSVQELPGEDWWIQVDLAVGVTIPEVFGGFEKRLIFIEKKPDMEARNEATPIEDIFEMRDLIEEQQVYHYRLDTEYFADLESFHAHDYLAEIQGKLEDGTGAAFGIREKDEWIGFAVVEKDQDAAYLLELIVKESARGKGYGKILVAACEHWAVERGLARLWTSVSAQNDSAFGFYERLGFVGFKERYAKAAR